MRLVLNKNALSDLDWIDEKYSLPVRESIRSGCDKGWKSKVSTRDKIYWSKYYRELERLTDKDVGKPVDHVYSNFVYNVPRKYHGVFAYIFKTTSKYREYQLNFCKYDIVDGIIVKLPTIRYSTKKDYSPKAIQARAEYRQKVKAYLKSKKLEAKNKQYDFVTLKERDDKIIASIEKSFKLGVETPIGKSFVIAKRFPNPAGNKYNIEVRMLSDWAANLDYYYCKSEKYEIIKKLC